MCDSASDGPSVPRSDTDQQSTTYANRLFVSTSKAVIVGRFKEPPEFMLPDGRPEHEVCRHFDAGRIHCQAMLTRMNPFRTNTCHELHFVGECPGLLEQNVGVPLC